MTCLDDIVVIVLCAGFPATSVSMVVSDVEGDVHQNATMVDACGDEEGKWRHLYSELLFAAKSYVRDE